MTGETLTEVYLEHRRALEMEERGGARARVEAVEVQAVESVEPSEKAASAPWRRGRSEAPSRISAIAISERTAIGRL